jgi:F-type H+-transporting ATPase subunit gamma
MESAQNIKRRTKSVTNINQITKAMELVAATKMRRSQEIALASRPYAFAALDILAHIAAAENTGIAVPLLEKRLIEKRAVMLVTSDKGLAGSFNSAVIRAAEQFFEEHHEVSKDRDTFIAIGQKAAAYLEKRMSLHKKFVRVGDYTTMEETQPIADFLVGGFLRGEWDEVLILSTHFRTALRQDVVLRRLLPVNIEDIRETAREIVPETGRFSDLRDYGNRENAGVADYLIEPSPEAVINDLVRHLVVMQIYHMILEANASEHAARRAAMKSASDNAEELAGDLMLLYNKSRQAGITREIVEITAGVESLKQ